MIRQDVSNYGGSCSSELQETKVNGIKQSHRPTQGGTRGDRFQSYQTA